ncbi:hypothetical protein A3L11_04515 [Thermococcus siculi]|uniref:Uncharacterized protein n=1 Tax=Thermococcus siculi TaxID=72803 RepID=A0A2Z2MPG0_9EURY|nr:hypothetical protein [Thermococcus siculi]ASJ08534.1 hypothetical protein A3L11_04515 [Thermococcus siculi]
MRRMAVGLLVLLSFFAYNAYTYHQLSSAEGAYKLAEISSGEKLIAVYHDENFWQFATYNPQSQELKVYYIGQNSPLFFRTKKTKTARTQLNYSPLALDVKLLEKVPKETPALLFAGKWHTRENPSKFPTVEQILKQYDNKTIRRVAILYAKKELWIKTYLHVDSHAYEIGTEDVLVIPSLSDKPSFIPVIEIPNGEHTSILAVYYSDVTITGSGKTFYHGSFKLNGQLIEAILNVSTHHLTNNTSFAKIESYCFFPNAGLNWVSVEKYFKGISMKERLPAWYLNRKTEDTPLKCNKQRT